MAYVLANLQSDIRSYTEVDDSVLTDAILKTIIQNAENEIYREVDSDVSNFYATSNTVAGNKFITIPSDLRIIRYVELTDSSGKQVFLDKRDPSFMAEYYDTPGTASGFPKYYASWDENFWLVAPTPDAAYAITLAYTRQPDSITSTTQPSGAPAATNGTYVSNKYQDMLLYCCLKNAYGYLKGPADLIQYYTTAFRTAMASYGVEQQGRRRRGEYDDGVIRTPIKSDSPSTY
jgi:hypothetical protein|tara:strand:+ start:89 stop:787 length:699 start_codon:yes stop_codon:yes gene_type:complete